MRIKKILKNEAIKDFIFINSFNFHYPDIASQIHPTLSIYHCVDPMIVPYDMRHGIKSEHQLVKDSDLVICTSKALYKEKILQNKNTYFVPNGTDSAHNKTSEADVSVPDLIQNLDKPIIGYLGTIERRIDYDLLEEVMALNPDKNFVLAGPISEGFMPDALTKKPNIHLLGPIPYAQVSQLINNFDVAIIPFKKDEVSDTIFPIKLFEYLSIGKPVVATDFNPDLKDFTADLVEYCQTPSAFSTAINNALRKNDDTIIEKRKLLAKENTWEKRAEQIGDIINSHLN